MTDQKKGVNPAAAGLVGAVVGAAAASAVIALSDKKTRKRMEKGLNDLKSEGKKKLYQFKKKLEEMRQETEEQLDEEKETPRKQLKPKIANS